MTIKQAYEAYCAECAKTDAGSHGAVLREATSREQELYNAWQQAIRDCTIWRDGDTTWHILSRWYEAGDLEMWHCRIIIPEHPDGILADCYASYIRTSAQPVDEERPTTFIMNTVE